MYGAFDNLCDAQTTARALTIILALPQLAAKFSGLADNVRECAMVVSARRRNHVSHFKLILNYARNARCAPRT